MKRKLFTLDGIMISFVSCMLYASIDVVCGVLGLPLLASVALSFVLGAGLEGALNKFAFSEAVQRKPVTRIILYVACVLSFVVGQYVFTSMMGLSLVDYLLSQLTGLIGFSILGFVVTMLIRAFASYPEGVSFAILIMNILSSRIDSFCESRYIKK